MNSVPGRQHRSSRAALLLWGAIMVTSTVFVGLAVADLRRQPVDTAGRLLRAYSEILPHLPVSGRVGFVRSGADVTESTQQYFVAQYALAPRVLVEDLRGVTIAITSPGGPSLLQRFQLIAQGTDGIKVFRRISAE